MTQLITISANTAALNIEALKHPRRISVKDQVKDIRDEAERNLRRAENSGDPGEVETVIPATTISIDLTATGQHPGQQATYNQAQAAYRDLED